MNIQIQESGGRLRLILRDGYPSMCVLVLARLSPSADITWPRGYCYIHFK